MYIAIFSAIFLMGAITSGFQANADFSVSNFETVVLRANGLAESIADSFILIKPIMNTLLNYDKIEGFQNLMVYLLENILCYVGAVWIMSKIYLKGAIGTTINSSRGKENLSKKLTLSDFKTKGKSRSYQLKEKKILANQAISFKNFTWYPCKFYFQYLSYHRILCLHQKYHLYSYPICYFNVSQYHR